MKCIFYNNLTGEVLCLHQDVHIQNPHHFIILFIFTAFLVISKSTTYH